MKRMMSQRTFVSRDAVTILCFLQEPMKSRESNKVSERTALWTLLNFIEEGPRTSFNYLLILVEVSRDVYA